MSDNPIKTQDDGGMVMRPALPELGDVLDAFPVDESMFDDFCPGCPSRQPDNDECPGGLGCLNEQ